MARLTVAEFEEAIRHFDAESVHLEMRDAYGTEVELPHLAAWAAGEPTDLAFMQPWCDDVRGFVAEGKTLRRAHVVSEPLSDYQRWAYIVFGASEDAGEEHRWVPRRLVSSIAFPGNDFWMLDRRLVIFHHYAGNGRNIDFTTSTDPHDIDLCSAAFEAVWRIGIPHHEYKPD
ncbi:DUF6879 family protein [Dactylosporangium sp. CA-152071]|uniref:DUF6879 family protein n=1 Tax=Dactylosporangium sp. CA-152071 TaxID=3239933 RepID=UPI003D91CA5B